LRKAGVRWRGESSQRDLKIHIQGWKEGKIYGKGGSWGWGSVGGDGGNNQKTKTVLWKVVPRLRGESRKRALEGYQ